MGDGRSYTYATAVAQLGGGYVNVSEACELIPPKANPTDPDDPRKGKVIASNPAPGAEVVPASTPVVLTVAKYTC